MEGPCEPTSSEPSSIAQVCPKHENRECIYVCSNPDLTESVFKCDLCVSEQDIQEKYLVPISRIIDQNGSYVWHWSSLGNEELLDKVSYSLRNSNTDNNKEKLKDYFSQLRENVLSAIDEAEEMSRKKAQQMCDLDSRNHYLYNIITRKEGLTNAIENTCFNQNESSERIKEILKQSLSSEDEPFLSELQENQNEFSQLENQLDFERPEKIKEQILAKLQKLSFFKSENVEELEDEDEKAEQGFMGQIQKFKMVFNKIGLNDLAEQSKRGKELRCLKEDDFSQISFFVETLIASKQPKTEESNDKKNFTVEDVMNLIKNKSNYVSAEMIQKMDEMLQQISIYVNTFQVKSICKKGFNSESYETLSELQVKKTSELGQELKRLVGEEEACQKALIPYLESFKNHKKQVQWKFQKTNYFDSQLLEFESTPNGGRVIQATSQNGTVVMDFVFKPELVYEFTCTFNRPLEGCDAILIGLVDETAMDQYPVGANAWNNFFHSSPNSTQINVASGMRLNSSWLNTTLTEMHFKICINADVFMVADSKHENILKGVFNYVDKTTPFRFGVTFHTPGDNFIISINNVTVDDDLLNVDSF